MQFSGDLKIYKARQLNSNWGYILFRIRDRNYNCKECGANFPKQIAVVSGDEGYEHGRHVHCLRCGAIVAEFVHTKEAAVLA